jgi:hypothetical protein
MTNSDPVKRATEEIPIRQFPRPCEYDGTIMKVTDRSIRCDKCGHELFNKPTAEICYCLNCSEKRDSEGG